MLIAPNVEIPDDVGAQASSVLGIRGSGKTNTATVLVEQLIPLGQQIVIVDPTDVWWGLRARRAAGTPAFPIPIMGGTRGDIPIAETPGLGIAIADAVLDTGLSMVISVRHLSKAAQRRVVTELLEQLYLRKANDRRPLLVVIDEASAFVPQRVSGEEARCVGAVRDIVRLGRGTGFGAMLIDQRPASVNKEVLTQVDMMIVHRVTSPQDRKAIEEWIEHQADDGHLKEVLKSLGELKLGQGYVWSPVWANIFAKAQIAERATYDSSATPKLGKPVPPPFEFLAVDIAPLRDRLKLSVEKAQQSDPKLMREEILRLKRELQEAKAKPAEYAPPIDIEDQIEKAVASAAAVVMPRAATIIECLRQAISHAEQHHRFLSERAQRTTPVPQAGSSPAGESYAEPPVRAENGSNFGNGAVGSVRARDRGAITTAAAVNGTARGGGTATSTPPAKLDAELGASHLKILEALAWWAVVGIQKPSRAQVAGVAGYTPTGGTFNRYVTALVSACLVEYPESGFLSLTPGGASKAGKPAKPPRLADLHARALDVLEAPHRKVLQVLLDGRGQPLGRTEVAERAGYEASGGTFNRYATHLVSMGMAVYPRKTAIAAAPWLFPSGLK
ncbi:MAG: DUF853 family protein [Phycisphaerales bacterium]|nr:DUF853 family protein [Phycisphaerales bacterium]